MIKDILQTWVAVIASAVIAAFLLLCIFWPVLLPRVGVYPPLAALIWLIHSTFLLAVGTVIVNRSAEDK